jgi:hypothetical protein
VEVLSHTRPGPPPAAAALVGAAVAAELEAGRLEVGAPVLPGRMTREPGQPGAGAAGAVAPEDVEANQVLIP